MDAFSIRDGARAPRVFYTDAGQSDNPAAIRLGRPDAQGWRHFVFQLNHYAGDNDVTIEADFYFKPSPSFALPRDAEPAAKMTVAVMMEASQISENELSRLGALTRHTYDTLYDTVFQQLVELNV